MKEVQLPDRGEVFVDKDGEWTVVSLTNKSILLLGPEGVKNIPLWQWPGALRPVSHEEAPSRSIPALLVGGDAGKHLDRIERLAKNEGVDIVAHWPGRLARAPSRIPIDVELIIVLVSHIGHSLEAGVLQKVPEGGHIQVVRVPSQGFEEGLRKELEKVGLKRRDSFGEDDVGEGRYVWTGSLWEWEAASIPQRYVNRDVVAARSALGTVLGASLGLAIGGPAGALLGSILGGVAGSAVGAVEE